MGNCAGYCITEGPEQSRIKITVENAYSIDMLQTKGEAQTGGESQVKSGFKGTPSSQQENDQGPHGSNFH